MSEHNNVIFVDHVISHLVTPSTSLYDINQLRLSHKLRVEKIMAQIIPVTRSGVVDHSAKFFESLGAPVERLLQQAAIPARILEVPGAVVPLQNAYRFVELACQSLHSEYLGLYFGQASSLDDFGSYGTNLKRSYTIGEYLTNGIGSYSTLTTGERFWLTDHGSDIRLNIESPGACGAGMLQFHLSTIALTIASFRQFTETQWSPGEIGLAYKSRERLPSTDLFQESRVLTGLKHSYISIPKEMLSLRLPDTGAGKAYGEPEPAPALPEDVVALVLNQIEALSAAGHKCKIEDIAESLAVKTRTLQRAIASPGYTYSQLLSESRLRRAVQWLDHTDKPITEIALELGYTDVSNFSRAFRRRIGLSPSDFRDGMNTSEWSVVTR